MFPLKIILEILNIISIDKLKFPAEISILYIDLFIELYIKHNSLPNLNNKFNYNTSL